MKRTISEELERIHTITYGKEVIEEQGLLDRILKGVGLKGDNKKVDDPKKADLVSDDVKVFFDTLQKAAADGGISQQERGSMNFQKEVESMQIGLVHLGYELPKYGIDGLFGPETAAAVTKFTNEKLGPSKGSSLNEAVNLVSQGGGIIGRPGQGTHNAPDWASRNAWDVTGPVGTEVYSITNGVVNKVKKSDGGLVQSGVKKIYGDQVTVKSSDGKPDVFYTHIDSTVNVGDAVKEGDVIGKIMQIKGMPSHVHVGISSGNLSDLASGLSNATGGSSGGGSLIKASPEMLNKLIELLQQKGITSEDLKKYIDTVATGGGAQFTDLDLTTDEGKRMYAEICQKYISTKQSNLLNITGAMMASGAIKAFEKHHKYVPPELALAQLTTEGGFSNDPNARPIKTKNPFNVGNTDSGANWNAGSVQDGIDRYYDLIAKDYLRGGKTAKDLVNNFVNKSGNRYASAGSYEQMLGKISGDVNKISQQVVSA